MKNTESLKKNKEFKRIFTKARWIKGKNIIVYFISNNQESNNLGIAVSKKTGTSVQRNRIKRLIRECYRLNENKISLGYNIVILWKSIQKDISFKELEKDFIETITKSVLRRRNE